MIALDKHAAPDERIDAIRLMGRSNDPGTLDAFLTLLRDADDDLAVRNAAVNALCHLPKHESYPVILEAIAHKNPEIRAQAISDCYVTGDSRLLFPLINLYRLNDLDDESCLEARVDIIRSIGYLEDSRATEFLEHVYVKDGVLNTLAREALHACKGNPQMLYTYHGKETDRQAAMTGGNFRGATIYHKENLKDAHVQRFLNDERNAHVGMAIYVVTPQSDVQPFSDKNTCHLTLAPRRTEHYVAAKGLDVLAAGEIGINLDTLDVEYIDNHSGGFFPGETSFRWVQKALATTGITLPERFSSLFPSTGYFTDEFLSQHPLYR